MDRLETTSEINNNFDDNALIKEFQNQNEAVFDQLVIKYKDRIFNICYRFLGNYEEANDMAQETFVKAYRNLNNFKFKSSFYTWIYTIAINTCKNKVNSAEYKNNRLTFSMDSKIEVDGSDIKPEIKDNSPTPSEIVASKELNEHIQTHINSLKEEHKTIIILRDIEDLAYEEIGKIMSITLGTVKSKLARAREILRQKLLTGRLTN